MPQYALLVYQPDGERPEPETLAPIVENLARLRTEMQDAGAWVFAAGLHLASTATALTPQDGKVLTTDGPYTEGHEHIGGFTILRANDLDEALAWGEKMALATTLPIEVRPIMGG
jgi:hypothetical protein